MIQIFFVSGAPKSGTTWVQRLLDAHPEIVCSGEGHFVAELVMPLVRLKEQYNRKLALVAERVYEGAPYYAPLADADVAAAASTLILRQMGKRMKQGAKAVGDKTPRHTDGLDVLARLFPAARFIHVVRHPCDVGVSLLHHALRAGYDDALTPGSKTYLDTIANASRAWTAAQTRATDFAAEHPGALLQVRYEDLIDRPAETAAAMCEHLNVAADAAVIEDALAASSFEKLSGRKPGDENARSFFRKGIAGDWKGRLSPEALAAVNAICGETMAAEGYSTDVNVMAV